MITPFVIALLFIVGVINACVTGWMLFHSPAFLITFALTLVWMYYRHRVLERRRAAVRKTSDAAKAVVIEGIIARHRSINAAIDYADGDLARKVDEIRARHAWRHSPPQEL